MRWDSGVEAGSVVGVDFDPMLAKVIAHADTRLRYIWWGNPDRDKRTLAAIDLYKKKEASVSIDPETYAWNDYWPKLATQAAGGSLA